MRSPSVDPADEVGDTDHSLSTPPASDINRAAPVVAETATEIHSTPWRLWETLVDVERWPEWNADVKAVSLQGGAREGSVFRWKTGSGTITSTFRTLEPPHFVSWTGKTMSLRATHVWSFEQNGGKTTLRTAESLEGPLARLLRRQLTKKLQKTLDANVEALKAHIEELPKSPRDLSRHVTT
jgi:uncharacterized protein YndB with AHSA1/START domain